MTNRERISKLIKANFPDVKVGWEQNGDTVKRDKNGVEIERHPAFGNHLVIVRSDSSKMGSIKWLNDEYKANYTESLKETLSKIDVIQNILTNEFPELSKDRAELIANRIYDLDGQFD